MSTPSSGRPSLALLAAGIDDVPLARQLAGQLALPLAPTGADPRDCTDFDALLVVCDSALALQQTGRAATGPGVARASRPGRKGALPGPVVVDFGSDSMRHRRRSGHNELLGRAVGVSSKRSLRVLDATAGLGRDSFVLADMGCEVTLREREPVIATLLHHGLQHAQASADHWLSGVAARMTLVAGDARSAAQKVTGFDVIYLDPMFPPRDKSAAVKKEMALFQLLLDDATAGLGADELLRWAVAQDVARVVVKRPAKAPFLAQRKPSHSIAGKAVRFDVYVRRALD